MGQSGQEQEEQEPKSESSSEQMSKTRVGFPPVKKESSKTGKRLIFVILALLIIGGIGYFIFGRTKDKKEISTEVTPTSIITEQTPTSTQTPVDKKEVKVQVLNGTGISGGAGTLKKELVAIGFSEIEVGNANNKNYQKTQVTFDEGLPSSLKNEILDKLESLYADIDSDTKSLDEYDVEIITGYPKGHTPTPSAKPTPTLTPTSAVTGSPTPTVTSTPTPTP